MKFRFRFHKILYKLYIKRFQFHHTIISRFIFDLPKRVYLRITHSRGKEEMKRTRWTKKKWKSWQFLIEKIDFVRGIRFASGRSSRKSGRTIVSGRRARTVARTGVQQRTGAVEETVQPTRRHRKQVVPATHRRLPAHAFRARRLFRLEERACRPIFKPRFTTGSAINGRVNDSRFIHRGNCIEQPSRLLNARTPLRLLRATCIR